MLQQLDAIFVTLKLQVQNHTCKPPAIFSAICHGDIAGVSNMFETCCNSSVTKIASSCRDKNHPCKQAFSLQFFSLQNGKSSQPIKLVHLVVPSPCETQPYNKTHYYMASSVSGQDEPNRAL